MRFQVLPNAARIPDEGRNIGYLWADNWDDWFEYNTLFVLTYYDGAGARHDVGGVKIGQFNMADKQRRPTLPERFEHLDAEFLFSWTRCRLL